MKARKGSEWAWEVNARDWGDLIEQQGDPWREHVLTPSIQRVLGPAAGLRWLDAGCGEGIYARLLAAGGARVVGVDCAPGLIARAEAQEQGSPLGIKYRVGNVSAPGGLGRGRYDVVLSCQTL